MLFRSTGQGGGREAQQDRFPGAGLVGNRSGVMPHQDGGGLLQADHQPNDQGAEPQAVVDLERQRRDRYADGQKSEENDGDQRPLADPNGGLRSHCKAIIRDIIIIV